MPKEKTKTKLICLLFLLATFLLTFSGSYTTNNYFYKPTSTDPADPNRATWLSAFDSTDTVIKDLVDMKAPPNMATNLLQTASDATSITPTGDTKEFVSQTNTQSAGTLTVNNPTGTPVNGQKLKIQIKSTNAQTFSFGNLYASTTDITLPTTIGAGKEILMGFSYNSIDSKWYIVALVNII